VDLCLVALSDWQSTLAFTWNIVKVAIGLGFVIFVHELGHFLVAKACGVKCEKFYVGFDIPLKIGPIQFPSRLGRVQWGETEYGIGILPLGGYVKMLGQDDDPRMAQQEAERIRIKKETSGEGNSPEATENESETDAYELDPRSFPAKPVPHRMAIISAGVIMNLIFAVLFATYAFSVGVPITPTEVGGTVPGSPAWQAGIEPRSRIIRIGRNGKRSENLRFDWDLSNGGVGLAQDKEDLPLLIRTSSGEEKLYNIRPVMAQRSKTKFPMIGVAPARTLTVAELYPSSTAEASSLKPADRIVAVNGEPVADAYEFEQLQSRYLDTDLNLTIERSEGKAEDKVTERMDVSVAPNPIKRLGLVMQYGPIASIRPGSPAERAGFRVGDLLESIDGKPIDDPMSLPTMLRPYHGKEIAVTVRRGGESVDVLVTPELPKTLDWTTSVGFPMAAEALGVAYQVTRVVREVVPDGPAAAAGIKPGDTMIGVAFRSKDPEDQDKVRFKEKTKFELSDDGFDWMFVFGQVQSLGSQQFVSLRYERGSEQGAVKLRPMLTGENNPYRGISLNLKQEIHTAENWIDALALGYRQTKEDAVRVVTFLKKLVTARLSPMNLGGPLSIAYVAGAEASQGIPRLLMFLTFLSANLAVLNFLPIPALDGGHMLFLIAEGIRGKPVDERVQIALTLAGVACLLGLMIFVFGLDIQRLFL
jgi:regulator of sigma E protease